MNEPTNIREQIACALLCASEILLREESISEEDVGPAMLEISLALVWMRKMPGGMKARDMLESRLREEMRRREAR